LESAPSGVLLDARGDLRPYLTSLPMTWFGPLRERLLARDEIDAALRTALEGR
jgi:hypothetical protein